MEVNRGQGYGLPWPSGRSQAISLRGFLPSPVCIARDVLDFHVLEKDTGYKVRDAEIILKQWLSVHPCGVETGFSLHFILRPRVGTMRDPSDYLDEGNHARIVLMVVVGAVGVCNEMVSGQGLPTVWLI